MIGSNSDAAAPVDATPSLPSIDDVPPLPLLATALTSEGDVLLVSPEPWLPPGTTEVRVERLAALLMVTNQTGDLIAMAPASTILPSHRSFHLALTPEIEGGPIRVLDLTVKLILSKD